MLNLVLPIQLNTGVIRVSYCRFAVWNTGCSTLLPQAIPSCTLATFCFLVEGRLSAWISVISVIEMGGRTVLNGSDWSGCFKGVNPHHTWVARPSLFEAFVLYACYVDRAYCIQKTTRCIFQFILAIIKHDLFACTANQPTFLVFCVSSFAFQAKQKYVWFRWHAPNK